MKSGRRWSLLLALAAILAIAGTVQARTDALWARRATGPALVLDGRLNEAAWSQAESLHVTYGVDAGIPGSGWKLEAGLAVPNDSLKATLKFLIQGDYLYLGARVKDRFVGGSKNWERFDGLLMSLKDHLSSAAPKPPSEYFYAWWYAEGTDPQPPGQPPAFIGRWATWPPGSPRTPEQIDAWDAVTIVDGLSNSDSQFDNGYTVEMRYKMSVMGYNVVSGGGDIIEWNISMYDCDGYWPLNAQYFCSNRTWVQSPWGNDAWYGELRIWTSPDVTTSSGPVPVIQNEMHVLNGAAYVDPVIDGQLTDQIWNVAAPRFDMRYGDDFLRQTYPFVGKWRAGQFQPVVNGGQAAVVDPADATVRMFFKNTRLYLGFDVRDQVVQYHPNFDRWDGFLVTPDDRVVRNPDNSLQGRRLSFQVGANGQAVPMDYLLTLVQQGQAGVAIHLNPGTTVDTLGINVDNGYTAEMWVDLTALGYPADLGDHVVFFGICLLDGDSFENPADSYGTRTWWYRQYEGECCPIWGYLDLNLVTGLPDGVPETALPALRNYPSPGDRTTVEYSLPRSAQVTLEVFDAQGRRLERRPLGLRPAGQGRTEIDGRTLPAGIYPYLIEAADPASGAVFSIQNGRMVILH